MGQRDKLRRAAREGGEGGEQAEFAENLKAVANADDEPAGGDEVGELIGQAVAQADGKDAAGAEVIAE
ncbi:MAG: hypothetical protein BWZ08_02608 [candidate division BRC1 bacterium ADurb.BinA292]|nr:MAG: hypothetical protein BWZ08_02608 [candidate division BRC1 bacterium ADurb.BinA292]